MPGPLTPEQKQAAIEMYAQHESFRSIARALLSTVPTVKSALGRAQVLRPADGPKKLDPNRSIERLINAPWSHWEALKSLGTKKGMVSVNEYVRSLIRKELEAHGALK